MGLTNNALQSTRTSFPPPCSPQSKTDHHTFWNPAEGGRGTYLGDTLDKRQTFKPHLAKAEVKAKCRLEILRKLTNTIRGTSEKILETVYLAPS